MQIVRQILHVIRQFVTFVLEETGVFYENGSGRGEKRHRLAEIDHLFYLDPLALKSGKIHGVIVRIQRLYQLFLILLPKIRLLPVKEICFFEISCLNVFL